MSHTVQLGYTLLYVQDVAATMDFYARAFGLKPGFSHQSGQYGEMQTGATRLGFVHHETAGAHGFSYQKSDLEHLPPAFELGLVVSNVEQAYDRALRAGATSVSAPEQKPWGQMVSYVRDCNGFLIEICSAISPT